jgi:hypothetical protein
MKIRNGFVSNSSSSSYLIYGWTIPIPDDKDDFRELLEELNVYIEEDIKHWHDKLKELLYVSCSSENIIISEGLDKIIYGNYMEIDDWFTESDNIFDWEKWMKNPKNYFPSKTHDEPKIYTIPSFFRSNP